MFLNDRVVWFRNHEGARRLDRDAGRIGLGYERSRAVVAAAGNLRAKTAMNIFSGAGNLLRICSLTCSRLLIGFDRLYGPPERGGWSYDIAHQFDRWEDDVAGSKGYRRPLFLAGDIHSYDFRPFHESIDVVFLDPPFGRETKSHLNIGELEAKRLLMDGIRIAWKLLLPGGRLIVAVPADWKNEAETTLRAQFTSASTWTFIGDTTSILMGVVDKG